MGDYTMPSFLLGFTDVGTASSFGTRGGSFLIQVDGQYMYPFRAVVYQCILNQDVDGAPSCYARFDPAHPDGKNGGLDFLRNGTSDENATFDAAGNNWEWHGVVSRRAVSPGVEIDDSQGLTLRDRNQAFPVFQPGKRFYVSSTSTPAHSGFPETDQRRYWDATTVSYGAITPPLLRLGVNLGDFGVAIRNDNGTSEAFFFGDSGAQEKVGEVSMHVFQRLFPDNIQEGHPVTFIVFPGSGVNPPKPAEQQKQVRINLWQCSQADNISELIDVMASGQSYSTFRGLSNAPAMAQARRNILNALIKHGNWHFFRDQAYNIAPPGRTPAHIRWIELAKRLRGI
jgi:hypothetical protein